MQNEKKQMSAFEIWITLVWTIFTTATRLVVLWLGWSWFGEPLTAIKLTIGQTLGIMALWGIVSAKYDKQNRDLTFEEQMLRLTFHFTHALMACGFMAFAHYVLR